MKKFIGVQLALFFISACMLYLYASNALAAEPKGGSKLVLDMTPREADIIWDAVNKFEDSWVPEGMADTQEMKKMRASAAGSLIKYVNPYQELIPVVKQLMSAYKDHKLSQFNRQKMKISQMLSHVWQSAVAEAKEKEQKRRSSLGWLGRLREDSARVMNNLYYYLFGVKKAEQSIE